MHRSHGIAFAFAVTLPLLPAAPLSAQNIHITELPAALDTRLVKLKDRDDRCDQRRALQFRQVSADAHRVAPAPQVRELVARRDAHHAGEVDGDRGCDVGDAELPGCDEVRIGVSNEGPFHAVCPPKPPGRRDIGPCAPDACPKPCRYVPIPESDVGSPGRTRAVADRRQQVACRLSAAAARTHEVLPARFRRATRVRGLRFAFGSTRRPPVHRFGSDHGSGTRLAPAGRRPGPTDPTLRRT